jgi:hypothetical protein
MGSSGSKGASAVGKSVSRRKLPDAGSGSSLARALPGDRDAPPGHTSDISPASSSSRALSGEDRARHAFFRPVRPNDGTLAPVVPAPTASVEARVKEKDATLVRRMDQLAGAISMTTLEISGHRRAAERARRVAAAAKDRVPPMKLRDAAAMFREVAREAFAEASGGSVGANGAATRRRGAEAEGGRTGGREEESVESVAARFAARYPPATPALVRSMLAAYRDAEPVEVTETEPGAPPGAMKTVKRWWGERL